MKFFEDLIRKENLPARIICLLVACGLWVYVMTDQNPIMERNVEVRLQQMNLPNHMMAFNVPDKVVVKVPVRSIRHSSICPWRLSSAAMACLNLT